MSEQFRRNLRILHVSSSYPLHPDDATAPFMHELLRAQVRRGHSVSALLPKHPDLVEGDREGVSISSFDYALHRKGAWGYGRSLDSGGRIRKAALAIAPLAISSMTRATRREVRLNSPDVVHLHWTLPQGAVALALSERIPVVISTHGADARFARGRLVPLTRRILGRADAMVAPSSAILDSFVGIRPEIGSKSKVIPHGADDDLFQSGDRASARRALGLNDDVKIVLAVGRLVRVKGFDVLVKALDQMSDPSVELVIVGDGPERNGLTRLARECRVRLVGQLNRQEVANWFAAADVVAIPSVEFGMEADTGPVVLMEALASGRAVVCTSVGMAPDVVQDDVNGYLVEPNDPRQLAQAISQALESSERLGLGAHRTFEAVGGWDRVAADLEQVYADAAARRSAILED